MHVFIFLFTGNSQKWYDIYTHNTHNGTKATHGTHKEKLSSTKQRFLSRPDHSCTPTMPNMKKTKKQSSSTLPSMGKVSSSRVTRIRIPERRDNGKVRQRQGETPARHTADFCSCIVIDWRIKVLSYYHSHYCALSCLSAQFNADQLTK